MAKRPKTAPVKPRRTAYKARTGGLVARLRVTQRQQQAVTLRLSGLSYIQIGNEMDIDPHVAWDHVNKAYESHAKHLGESVEQVRELELGKLDKIDAVLWGLLEDDGGELLTVETGMTVAGPTNRVIRKRPGVGGVVDRLLAVAQRRAALMGLDAAAKYEHTGQGGGPIALEAISRIVKRGDELRALNEANKPSKGKES